MKIKVGINGFALRVPTPTVSITDLVCEINKTVTKEEINKAFEFVFFENFYCNIIINNSKIYL